MAASPHASQRQLPDPWIERFAPTVARGGRVLDLACGEGRHARLFVERGHPVTAVDRRPGEWLRQQTHPRLEVMACDLEQGPWPFAGQHFAAVVVVNYLWRPLLPAIINAVAAGGVLLYATFARGQERFGRPRNPSFLLRPNELLEAACGELTIHAYEHGRVSMAGHRSAMRQRLYARRAF